MGLITRKYIIYATALTRSNGVRAMYKLYTLLRDHGYETYIFCDKEPHRPEYKYVDFITQEIRDEYVIVYPEGVIGNPLQIRRVVRWVMYFPGYFGGAFTYHPSETIFAWYKDYYDAPELRVTNIEHDLFFDAGLPKTHDCYFVYKGDKWRDVKELDGLVEINAVFPPSRRELAHLLQNTGTLYSFDPYTVLLWEAKLCGVRRVLIITKNGFKEYNGEPAGEDPPEVYERQLLAFIKITQALPAAIEMEKTTVTMKVKILKKRFLRFVYHFVKGACGQPPFLEAIKNRYLRQTFLRNKKTREGDAR